MADAIPIRLTSADYARLAPLMIGDVVPEGVALTMIHGTGGSWNARAANRISRLLTHILSVMAGLVPAIQGNVTAASVDAQDKNGHDELKVVSAARRSSPWPQPISMLA